MPLTAKVKDELLGVRRASVDAQAAEATAMIRFAGSYEATPRGLVIVVDFAAVSYTHLTLPTNREV